MIALTLLAVFTFYIVVAILVTRFFVKRARTRKGKWLKGLATTVIFVLIPTWDAILGTIYFRYLCATEGGPKIYKSVKLSKEYFNKDGEPAFVPGGPWPIVERLGDQFTKSYDGVDSLNRLFEIKKTAITIKAQQSGVVLGTYTYFINFGGWVKNHAGFHVTGTSCPGRFEENPSFERRIFNSTAN